MFRYQKLDALLREKGLTRTDLTVRPGLSSRTVAKIGKGEKLSAATLGRIAAFLGCAPEELYEVVSENPVLQRLREEKAAKISGGLYHALQVRMTYNTNHIEGSRLSEDQTRQIFETATIDATDGVPVDDILETVHHFRAIDYVIDVAEEPLSEEMIKHLHYLLKHDIADERLPWFAVGDYKKKGNTVGGRETAKPGDVAAKMKKLLREYGEIPSVTLEDVVAFHARFEKIHPFQDGNGRVGRLIALKECLAHRIVPFLIEDAKKQYYYRGLAEWNAEPGYLLETCRDGQETFGAMLRLFDAEE